MVLTHTDVEIRDKMFEMGRIFHTQMERKEYRAATVSYRTVLTVAVFIGLNDADKLVLFGDRETGKTGLFAEEEVQRAFYHTSVKGNDDSNKDDYEQFLVRQRLQRRTESYIKK